MSHAIPSQWKGLFPSGCWRWIAAAAALSLVSPSRAANVSADDWPQFLGPHGNSTSDMTGLLDHWPNSGPRVAWHQQIGAGYGAPSVRGNLLVVHHRAGDEEIVEALDADNGTKVWRYAYPSHFVDPYGYNNGPRSAPLLTEMHCYTFGAEGKLLCLELKTGKLIWQRDTGREWNVPEAFFGVGSSPVLEQERIVVMVGGQPNSGVVAFDPLSGKTLWESVGRNNWQGQRMIGWPGEPLIEWRESEKQASYSTPYAVTIDGKRHLLCLMRQGLVSLDPSNGQVRFSFWFRSPVEESVNASNPVVVGNRILISAAYYHIGSVLLEVMPPGTNVHTVWRNTVLETHWNTPIYHQGYLYAFSGRNEPDAHFRCLEFKTGKLMWDLDQRWRHYGLIPPDRYGRGSCIFADGKLFVLGEAGLLGIFKPNPRRAEEVCHFQVPYLHFPSWAAPVLARKKLYLRAEDQLVCLNLKRQ